jgi:serine/threonine protein kinase
VVLLLTVVGIACGGASFVLTPARGQEPNSNPADKGSTAPAKKKPPRRAKTWYQRVNWTLVIVGAVAVVGVVGIFLVMKKMPQKKRRADDGDADSDTMGGYRLQRHIVTGQTSQVYEVVELASGRHFAMKLLLPETASNVEHRQMLLHEASVGQKLTHPNVIKIVHVSKGKNPYFVMEYFPSGSLKMRIMHKETDFIKMHAQDILKKAATALAYMNASGWIHRDVKPDNILVNSAGEVRLIDFALAQRIRKKSAFGKMFAGKAPVQGTRSYMSPEQIRGLTLDARSDIYSFGATAYEIVTGRPPFRANSSQELLAKHLKEKPAPPQVYNAEVSEEFSRLILRMLAKDPKERPRDFHEVLMAMRTMLIYKGVKQPKTPME